MDGKNEAGELAATASGAAAREIADAAVAQGVEQQMENGDGDVPMEAAAEELEEESAADSGISKSSSDEEIMANEDTVPVPWTCACMRRGVPAPTTVVAGRKRKRDVVVPEADGSSSSQAAAAAAEERLPAVASEEQPPAMPLTPVPLQRLLDACRAFFSVPGTPPMSAILPYIRGIMDTIRPNDVGARDDVRFFNRMNTRGQQNPPIITTKTIFECSNFKIATFFIPFGVVMPLHDHPGMTVFSKVINGSGRMEAYDWVRPRVLGRSGPWMLAEKVRDHVVTSAVSTWVLFPDARGNIHRFVAEEDHCMFLDVLTPPYAPAEQRRCAYYQESSRGLNVVTGGQRRQLTLLKEIPQPRNMRIVDLPFQGSLIF